MYFVVRNMVQRHILSAHERQLIKNYFEKGEKPTSFRVLLYRLRKYYKRLDNDMKIIDLLLEKAGHTTKR